MKRLMVLIGVLGMFLVLGTFTTPASADGFALHLGGPGYHVDIGRPHYSYYNVGYGGYDSCYRGGYYSAYGGYGGGVWHDTSHYDYHPGEFVRHRNHYHYVPGHYDFHEDGHWDHHGW